MEEILVVTFMEEIALAIFTAFGVLISTVQRRNHKQKIRERVKLIGGEIISIKRRYFSTGPFVWVRRGRRVYRFEYKIDNDVKKGWVKFGDPNGPFWKL